MSGYAEFPYAGGAYAGALAPGASPPSDVGINLPTVTVSLDDGTGTFPYDITQYVEIGSDGGTVSFTRGREDNYGEVQASTCSLTLNNTDGRFTLGSTSIATPTPIYVDNQIRVTFAVGAVSSTRFTGYVQNWPTAWPGGGDKYAVTQVTAVDRLARMARRVLRSIVEETIRLASPDGLYPLKEPAGSSVAYDTSGSQRSPMQLQGGGGTVTFDGSAVTLAGEQTAGRHLIMPASGVTTLSVWFKCASVPGSDRPILVAIDGSVGASIMVGSGAAAGRLVDGTATILGGSSVADNAWHHLIWVPSTGAVYVDGTTLSAAATLSTFTHVSMGGTVAAINGTQRPSIAGSFHTLATFAGSLSAANRADQYEAGATGFSSDSSDERIARYAAYAGVATGDMVFEVGVVQNVPHVDITGTSPLAAIAAVNAAEQGLVFVRGDGKLVFQNRDHRASQVAADWSFAASPNLQGDVSFVTDMQSVTNYVTATRINGSTQVAQNAASIAKHEQYPTSYDNLLVATDMEALDLANKIVSTHAEPGARLPSATVDLMANITAFRQAWLGIELSDRVTITGLPAQAPASNVDLIIEGWTETLSNSEWAATLNTSPFSLYSAWILGDSTYSVLGSTTRLG